MPSLETKSIAGAGKRTARDEPKSKKKSKPNSKQTDWTTYSYSVISEFKYSIQLAFLTPGLLPTKFPLNLNDFYG